MFRDPTTTIIIGPKYPLLHYYQRYAYDPEIAGGMLRDPLKAAAVVLYRVAASGDGHWSQWHVVTDLQAAGWWPARKVLITVALAMNVTGSASQERSRR